MKKRRRAGVITVLARAAIALFLIPCVCLAGRQSAHAQQPEPRPCALELVLAVDVSGSVDEPSFALQIRGYAAAFRDESVQHAIALLGRGGLAVTLVQWSSVHEQEQSVGWTRVGDRASVEAFAARVEKVRRRYRRTGTAIGAVINRGADLIALNGLDCARKIIDVSADGQSNVGPDPVAARERAVLQGITVNGLAITVNDPELDDYFARTVIAGPGAFVVEAEDYADIAVTIRQKLLRELAPNLSQERKEERWSPG